MPCTIVVGILNTIKNVKFDKGYLNWLERIKLTFGLSLSIPNFVLSPQENEQFDFECDTYLLFCILQTLEIQNALPMNGSANLTPYDVGWLAAGYYPTTELTFMLEQLSSIKRDTFFSNFDAIIESHVEKYFRYQPDQKQLNELKEHLWSALKKLQRFLELCIKNNMGICTTCI